MKNEPKKRSCTTSDEKGSLAVFRRLAQLVFFVLVGAGLALPQNPKDHPATVPVPWAETLRITRAQPSGDTALLRRVPAAADAGWLSEQYGDEELSARLEEFSHVLATLPSGVEKLATFIHPSFRGTPLQPRQRVEMRRVAPRVERMEPFSERTITAAELPGELAGFLEGFSRFERMKFKIVDVTLDPADPQHVATRVWYDIFGYTSTGSPRQLNSYWQLDWLRVPTQGWQFTGLRDEGGWLVESSHRILTDVTASALPPGPASEQLRHGVDYWTLSLDAATGMDIYGHNGLAVADVDGDGWEDFYVAQPAGLPNRLFRNNRDGTFTDVTAGSGLDVLDSTRGVVFFDYDNDGRPDLLLLGSNGPMLFHNDGHFKFTYQDPERVGLTLQGKSFGVLTSACVADYNRDGWLDVYVTAYQLQSDVRSFTRRPTPYYDAQNGPPNILFRNNGDGTFTDVTAETGLDQNNNRWSFACAWGDYDNDGFPDLYVANDFGRSNLYHNDGHGHFTDVAAAAGVENIGAGMSAAWGDYDNDGRLDLYVGNMWSSAGLRVTTQPVFKPDSPPEVRAMFRHHAKGNALFHNRGDGTFEDVSEKAGVALGRWAWGSDFLDLDLDGFEDIGVANGFITNESKHDL